MRRFLAGLPRAAVLLVFAVAIAVPLSLVVFTSLKTANGFFASPFSPPSDPQWQNYGRIIDPEGENIWRAVLNSAIVTASTVALVLLLGSMAAYAIARIRGWRSTALFAFFVGGLMVAPQVYMTPLFVIISQLQLVNTFRAVVLVSVAVQLPIAVLVLTGFMRSLPQELIDAAFVDGGSEWDVYRRIVVPLTRPAFATVAIFSLVITWNDLLFPLLFLRVEELRTLPLALLQFRGEYLTNYPVLFAGVTLATIPMVAAYLAMQRYFVEGLTAGSLKG